MELVGRLLHHEVAARDVEEGGLHVALDQRGGAHFRAGHEADLAELDALLLLDEERHRLGPGSARMDGERLAIERLPVWIRLGVDDREEAQGLELAEDPDRRAGLLDDGVRSAKANIGLSAQHGLGGEVLLGELDQLDIDAPLAHPLERDEEVERLDALDVAERDPDAALDGSAIAWRSSAPGLPPPPRRLPDSPSGGVQAARTSAITKTQAANLMAPSPP